MGSGACTYELGECEQNSQTILEKLDKARVLGSQKDAVEPQVALVADGTASLSPITPDSDRENGDFPIDLKSPPSFLKKPPNVTCIKSNTNRNGDAPFGFSDDTSPRTPEDGVFDPFAPGPDDLVLAPQCKKFISKSRSVVARQLNFDSPVKILEGRICADDVESISDEEMFEAVYENLLEAIVSKQTEGAFAECSRKDWDSDDCKTPPLEQRLNGVAETCPGAPLKPAGKSRKIDLELIRRLEF